ncbi:hypothetical protein NKG94_29420 [Micromonospora sp. M12]
MTSAAPRPPTPPVSRPCASPTGSTADHGPSGCWPPSTDTGGTCWSLCSGRCWPAGSPTGCGPTRQPHLALNPEDQTLYEWFLAVDARAMLGDFDLLTDRLNAPDGVNLMANTTVIALGVVLAPVTLLLGAPVTFALLAAANLAGTALAWYLLFHRTLRTRRLAAALGGGLCGFGPGMVSQTNSHLHMTAQWLVPVIVWLVIRLLRASDPGPGTPTGPAAPDSAHPIVVGCSPPRRGWPPLSPRRSSSVRRCSSSPRSHCW